jgi:urea transport system permease protein
MVIFAAVGGRLSLVGAVYGALLVNAGKTFFSETFPEAWLFLMAALFIGVTMLFPNGLAGVYTSHVKPWWQRRQAERRALRERLAAAHAAVPEAVTKHDTQPAVRALPRGAAGQT